MTLKERILNSCEPDENGCWIWTKSKQHNGYGVLRVRPHHNRGAHRWSYIAFKGEIPDGHDVCHKCDVRACVNPDHLFVGTRSDNIKDAVAKGRMNLRARARGENQHAAKLTEKKVIEILQKLREGRSRRSLAAEYGVSYALIAFIHRGTAWRHIDRRAA